MATVAAESAIVDVFLRISSSSAPSFSSAGAFSSSLDFGNLAAKFGETLTGETRSGKDDTALPNAPQGRLHHLWTDWRHPAPPTCCRLSCS
ncbi:unnamed protein product [Calypogeia fissa]